MAFSGLISFVAWPFVAGAALVAAVITPVRAADSIDDLFKELVVGGCIGSFESGIPVESYAQGHGLTPANSQLAAAFLRGRSGSAYIKATPQTVLIIADTGDTCTVATRVAPDLAAFSQSFEAVLAGLKTPFIFVKEEKPPMLGGGVALARTYDGAIGSQPFGILLSTMETGSPQATATVYRKSR